MERVDRRKIGYPIDELRSEMALESFHHALGALAESTRDFNSVTVK